VKTYLDADEFWFERTREEQKSLREWFTAEVPTEWKARSIRLLGEGRCEFEVFERWGRNQKPEFSYRVVSVSSPPPFLTWGPPEPKRGRTSPTVDHYTPFRLTEPVQ
jgi:hypothetical protein